jgi:hypothetical protein
MVSFIIEESAALNLSGDSNEKFAQANGFLPVILSSFSPVLTQKPILKKWRKEVRMNVLTHREDDELATSSSYPSEAVFDDSISFKDGIGVAGRAFATNKPIYVPAIRYNHGISIDVGKYNPEGNYDVEDDYDVEDEVFKRTWSETFKSVLCVPIPSKHGRWGVLSIDSPKQDPFGLFEIRAARVAASLIGSLLDRAVYQA